MTRVLAKVAEYLSMGVARIWMVDVPLQALDFRKVSVYKLGTTHSAD
jgi:hypothetical protein